MESVIDTPFGITPLVQEGVDSWVEIILLGVDEGLREADPVSSQVYQEVDEVEGSMLAGELVPDTADHTSTVSGGMERRTHLHDDAVGLVGVDPLPDQRAGSREIVLNTQDTFLLAIYYIPMFTFISPGLQVSWKTSPW